MSPTVHEVLLRARPGSSAIYHVGVNLKGCRHLESVRALYDSGHVDLVQQRVEGGFAYIVQFRYTRAKIADWGRFYDRRIAA